MSKIYDSLTEKGWFVYLTDDEDDSLGECIHVADSLADAAIVLAGALAEQAREKLETVREAIERNEEEVSRLAVAKLIEDVCLEVVDAGIIRRENESRTFFSVVTLPGGAK